MTSDDKDLETSLLLSSSMPAEKNLPLAYCLWLVGGLIGLHQFYLGNLIGGFAYIGAFIAVICFGAKAYGIPMTMLLLGCWLFDLFTLAYQRTGKRTAQQKVTLVPPLVAAIFFCIAGGVYPQGGFYRDLISIVASAIVGSALSFSLKPSDRRNYFYSLCAVTAVLLILACGLKFCLKDTLVQAYSAIHQSVSSDDPNYVPDSVASRKYWEKY